MLNIILEFSDKSIKKPIDPKGLEVDGELDMKVRLMILDGVKDSLIPHMYRKKISWEMWEALQDLFHNKNEN